MGKQNQTRGAGAADPTSVATAAHYVWGTVCDGWHLVRTDALSVIQERMPPGTTEAGHLHRRAHQFFLVLRGRLTIEAAGVTHQLGPLQGLAIPARAPHRVHNAATDPAEFLVVSRPPSHDDREATPDFSRKDIAMPRLDRSSPVTAVPAATPAEALAHFLSQFAFETDCSDVHKALESGDPGFVLLDVRSPDLWALGHVPGSVNLPHQRIVERNIAEYPDGTLFVVYCAGPHCNGADRAAVALARLGRPVKKMIGGIEGWKDEGYSLTLA